MAQDFGDVFVRPMKLGGIGPDPVERHIEADEAERAKLATLFGLPAIAALTGDFTLQHQRGGVIAAQLRLRAKVTQVCVISLEPFEAKISESADLRLVPAASVREGEELDFDPETLEGPDEIPYAGESIDLGAILAEQLALALPPYPRKPGAHLPVDLEDDTPHPFAALEIFKTTKP